MTGIIFDIAKFSLHDGPGIRTTLFLKGCPLDCIWCHNPESKSKALELGFMSEKCVACGMCANVCGRNVHRFENGRHIIDRERCNACGKCVEACKNNALKIIGKKISVDEIMKILEKDKPYFEKSGGGLTVSGGEPLYSFDFCLEILKEAKQRNIHTCIETSGCCSEEKIRKIAEYTDLFLFDFKADRSGYENFCKMPLEIVLNNLKVIFELNKQVILRCPMIPGINDTKEHIADIVELSGKYNFEAIEILPYHRLGESKAQMVGRDYLLNLPEAGAADKRRWMDDLKGTNGLIDLNI